MPCTTPPTRKRSARLRHECELRERPGSSSGLVPRTSPPDRHRRSRCDSHARQRAVRSLSRVCRIIRAAAAAGAHVFERSRGSTYRGRTQRCALSDASRVVENERVIIATGYATPQFRPLAGRFRMYRTYVLATEPIERRASAMRSACPTSWCGTPSGRITTRAGHRTTGSCSAAGIGWCGRPTTSSAVRDGERASCARTSKAIPGVGHDRTPMRGKDCSR